MENLIALTLVNAVCTFVCFQNGRKLLGLVGVVAFFGVALEITPLLIVFPLAGAVSVRLPRSPGGLPPVSSDESTALQASADRKDILVFAFLAAARDRGVIDEESFRRLVAMLRPEVSTTPVVAAPSVVQPPAARLVPIPPVIPGRTPVVPSPSVIPVQATPVPAPIVPPVPREPSEAAQTRSRLWQALVSDVALHGFSYLGVLLTFVAVLGFLLFSFADLPDAAQPPVELIIALIFFGWAWLLRRQDAERVANGMELIGGMVLPLIVFASLVDNAPLPPDFKGAGLVVALTVSAMVLAVLYSFYTARRPESVLRYLVAPLLWLGALTLGFAFKTDETLVGDAITRLVSPQPALASVAIALTLLACRRWPGHRLSQPTVTSALVGLPVAYLITVSLAFGEDWARTWPMVVLGAATLVSAEILARWYHKESWVGVMRPLLLAGVLAPLTPSLEVGWAGLIVVVAYVGLFELDRRLSPAPGLGQLLAAIGVAVGAFMTLSNPWSALIVFTSLTVWSHLRRVGAEEMDVVAQIFALGAALFPVGIGYALIHLIDPALAWLVMAGILMLGTAAIRVLKTEDSFWPHWLGEASLVVAFGAGIGWNEGFGNDAFGAPAVAVTAVGILLLPRWAVLRLWVGALLLVVALAMALETADLPADQRAMAWAGLGLTLVVIANIVRRAPGSHVAAIGHLVAAFSLLALPSGPARSAVLGAWAIGWVASTVGGELGGDSLTALLERLASSVDASQKTQTTQLMKWLAPILMTASLPPAVITVANLSEEFEAHASWTGLTLALLAIVYAGVARLVVSRRPLSRVLATGAVITSLVGIGLSLEDSWPAIASSVLMIAIVVLVGEELRHQWFVWAAWLVSVGLVALLGEQFGVPRESISTVTLVWGAILVVGGLVADDVISTRRMPGEVLRVSWLRHPVYVGALAIPISLTHLFLQPPTSFGWWAIGTAGVCLAVAFLLRIGTVSALGYVLLVVGITDISPRPLLDEPWLYVIPAAVLVALSWIFARYQSDETAADEWLRWDLAPLIVAHLIAGFALFVAFVDEAPTPTALAFGVLSLVIGLWRRGRPWIEVGNLLVLIAAFDTGPEWLALALAATSVRGVIGAWRAEGAERLSYLLIGSLSAGLAWVAVLDWQAYPAVDAVGYSSLAFGALLLGLGIASRTLEMKLDSLTIWGGLGLVGLFMAGTFALALDLVRDERIGLEPAIGFGMLTVALELAWPRVKPVLRLLTVGAAGLTWLGVVLGMGWERSTAIRITSVVFGLLAVLVTEVVRFRVPRDGEGQENPGLWVAQAWFGLAAAGVVVASLGYRGDPGDGFAIASGLLLLSVGLARGAAPLQIGVLREISVIAALVAINVAMDAAAMNETLIAVVTVLLSATATFASLWLWHHQRAASWVTPLVVLAIGANLETIFFALQAWPDRAMAVAVLLSIGAQAVAIGVTRSLPGVLALGPPAAGLAFVLSVGESVSGSAQWYTVPIALVLLSEVEILRATRRAAGASEGQDAVILEWAGIGLLATPALVEMFTSQLVYGLVAIAIAAAILIWAIVSRVRRRAVAAACLAVAAAVLMIFAAASAAAPDSAAFWILAGGIGFAVMLVAALVEAYRTRRGQVMARVDQLMQGWE
ncbi:MAG: hypothetical protein WD895_02980 [Acidimicrobiia bacterium]